MDIPTTPDSDNPNGDATPPASTTSTDPNGTGQGTGTPDANNPDPSKSTDTPPAADGDKKPTDKPAEGDGGKTDDTPAPLTLDTDLDDWAKKRGFPEATSDEQRQAYQQARNEQREFTRSRQAATQIKDAKDLDAAAKDARDKVNPDKKDDDDSDDPVEQRLNAIEEERHQERELNQKAELYRAESVTTAEHNAIKDILMEKVDKAGTDTEKLKVLDFWGAAAQLPDLLALARAKLASGTDNSADLEKAAQEERERIAKESNASSPGPNAKTPPSDKSPEQERTERLKARYSNT